MGDKVECLVIGRNTLLIGYVAQILHAVLNLDAVEVVDLTTREDGGDNLMLLGGSQDEDSVAWWLLKGLEEGVERRRREHMNLVDNKNRVATLLRYDAHLLDKVADVVYRVVGCGIQLVNIERTTLVERTTRLALVAGLAILRIQTVDCLGKDAGTGGLAYTARAAEEVGVCQLTTLNSVLQGRCYMTLTHDRSEGRGAILAC